MAAVDFFWDPMCPFAWITSRWVVEVAGQRPLDVRWRPISLRMLNEASYAEDDLAGKKDAHAMGLALLRVAVAVDTEHGNEAVGRLYTALGTAIHLSGDREATMKVGPKAVAVRAVGECGLPVGLAAAIDDESGDALIREGTHIALERAGRDLGTPILTFGPPDGPSFFGPVISQVPRGPQAVKLWDAVETLAHHPSFAELKRSFREPPQVAS